MDGRLEIADDRIVGKRYRMIFKRVIVSHCYNLKYEFARMYRKCSNTLKHGQIYIVFLSLARKTKLFPKKYTFSCNHGYAAAAHDQA